MSESYFFEDEQLAVDPISGERPVKLKYCVGGKWMVSKTEKYMPCYNPSTGAVIAYAPQCTAEEVASAVQAAQDAYPAWADTPVNKRVQVLFRMKALVDKHMAELTHLLAKEEGKKWMEAMGDKGQQTELEAREHQGRARRAKGASKPVKKGKRAKRKLTR